MQRSHPITAKLTKEVPKLENNVLSRARTLVIKIEIASAGNRQRTVYELNSPITSPKVHNRCLNILDSVNKEVELLIRRSWPSHAKSLREAGLD